jgi:hypothetical protein
MRMTPRACPPPAALAAPPANAVCDALGIEKAGGDVKGVAQRLTDADRRLCSVYGDTIHQNDGTHLDGGIGIAEDAKWQRLHLRAAACNLPLYDLPNGRWATRFLKRLTNLCVGVVERRWNSERPLVFQACILQRVRGISRFHDVKPIIWGRLDAWDAECYVALVREVEEATLDIGGGGGGPPARQEDATSIVRKYHNMVLGGKVLEDECPSVSSPTIKV